MKGPTTTIIHTAERRAPAASLTTPVYETTTFVFETAAEVRKYNEGKSDKYLYSRYTNPTVEAVERKIALLEGAETAMVLSSGMAATATALLSLVRAGDEVICSAAIYGGTFHFLTDLLSRFDVKPRFVTLDELSDPASVLRERTRLLWFESPNNPTLRCVDIAAVAAACRARNVISVIDNTFATPINQRPLELGVDIVMESATKYLNGHSDVTAGVLAGSAARLADCVRSRRLVGTILDPYPAYALGRGLKTLSLRVARHNANALTVARWLERDSRIERVYHPGLESHPDHAIAKRQMSGFSGMICIDLGGGLDRASRFYDRLQIFQRAASLGGPESLCSLPVLTSHTGYSDEDLRKAGVTASMARLSVGLEDPEDLIDDLDQALG